MNVSFPMFSPILKGISPLFSAPCTFLGKRTQFETRFSLLPLFFSRSLISPISQVPFQFQTKVQHLVLCFATVLVTRDGEYSSVWVVFRPYPSAERRLTERERERTSLSNKEGIAGGRRWWGCQSRVSHPLSG